MIDRIKQLIIHSSPLALGIVLSYIFWQSNYVLLAIYSVLVLAIILMGKDRDVEFKILVYGIITGAVIEIIGTQVSGYQSFAKPDFMGIPYWLAVSWGYGFILMKRISLILGTSSPWINN